jgi:hypothetical protein
MGCWSCSSTIPSETVVKFCGNKDTSWSVPVAIVVHEISRDTGTPEWVGWRPPPVTRPASVTQEKRRKSMI